MEFGKYGSTGSLSESLWDQLNGNIKSLVQHIQKLNESAFAYSKMKACGQPWERNRNGEPSDQDLSLTTVKRRTG